MMILVGNYFIKYWTFYSLETYGMQMLSISTKASISLERHPLRNGDIRDWLMYLLFLICLCSPFHIYISFDQSPCIILIYLLVPDPRSLFSSQVPPLYLYAFYCYLHLLKIVCTWITWVKTICQFRHYRWLLDTPWNF